MPETKPRNTETPPQAVFAAPRVAKHSLRFAQGSTPLAAKTCTTAPEKAAATAKLRPCTSRARRKPTHSCAMRFRGAAQRSFAGRVPPTNPNVWRQRSPLHGKPPRETAPSCGGSCRKSPAAAGQSSAEEPPWERAGKTMSPGTRASWKRGRGHCFCGAPRAHGLREHAPRGLYWRRAFKWHLNAI